MMPLEGVQDELPNESFLLGVAWQALGDCLRLIRLSNGAVSPDSPESRQTATEADAYRRAADCYRAAWWLVNPDAPDTTLLMCGLLCIQCLGKVGAWDESLSVAKQYHQQLKSIERSGFIEAQRLTQLKAQVFLESANVMRMSGDYEGASYRIDDARRLFSRVGDRHGQALCLVDLGTLHLQAGDITAASRALDEAARIGGGIVSIAGRITRLRQLIAQNSHTQDRAD
jgi:hypothetical protein